jgi:hypothetical protein
MHVGAGHAVEDIGPGIAGDGVGQIALVPTQGWSAQRAAATCCSRRPTALHDGNPQ